MFIAIKRLRYDAQRASGAGVVTTTYLLVSSLPPPPPRPNLGLVNYYSRLRICCVPWSIFRASYTTHAHTVFASTYL